MTTTHDTGTHDIGTHDNDRRGAFASAVDTERFGEYRIIQQPDDPRPLYRFEGRISNDGSTPYAAEAGRYHIYSGWFCPWAQRVTIAHALAGLEDVISVSYVDGVRDGRGWAFRATYGPDPVNGFTLLRDAYEATEPGFDGHVSVPTLWDRVTGRVVSNQFRTIGIDLATQFGALATTVIDTYPADLADEIEQLDTWIGPNVNKGVHTAASHGPAAAPARALLLDTFHELDLRLGSNRFLLGDRLTEADIRLFVTLVRYDHGANADRSINSGLSAYPNLWAYARDLYAIPAFRDTTDFTTFSALTAWDRPANRGDRLIEGRVMADSPNRPLHLAVALDGAGFHPAAGATRRRARPSCSPPRTGRRSARTAERGLLDFVTIEDSFGVAVVEVRRSRRPHRPGPRPARCGPDRVADRPGDPPHRARPDRRRRPTPSRSTSHRRSPRSTTSAAGVPAGSRRSPARRPRRPTSGSARSPSSTDRPRRSGGQRVVQRPVRRGDRRRRGRPPAVGQLGGRRHHQGRRRPAASSTATSSTTSTSTGRSSASRVPRSCPAHRRASRSSQRSPTSRSRSSSPPASADVVFVTPADTDDGPPLDRRRRAGRADRRARGSRRSRCSPTSSCSSTTTARRPSGARTTSTRSTAPRYRSDAAIFAGTAARARRPPAGVARRSASTASACAPA